MSKTMIFAFVVVMAVAAMSAPYDEPEQNEFVAPITDAPARLPRATCDLLSGFGVQDSVCAAHCLAIGRKGGWCDKGVCHCRR